MAWEVWLTFLGAAIAIAVSPGAGAIQSMATGLTHGVRRGYWSILGYNRVAEGNTYHDLVGLLLDTRLPLNQRNPRGHDCRAGCA